ILLTAWRAYMAVRRARHNRRIVRPLFRTLAQHAYHSPGDSPARHLTVPRDYASNPKAVVRLNLSEMWEGTDAQRRMISTVAKNRLGGDWAAHFRQDMRPPYVEFKRLPEPPGRVMLADFIPRIDASASNVLALGLGCDDLVSVDLDSEAPHIALSMGTGGGKSDTVALIVAQLRRK